MVLLSIFANLFAGDPGSIPGLGRPPGEGKEYPLQYSGLENSMDCIVHWVTKSWTQLSHPLSEPRVLTLPHERPSESLPGFPFPTCCLSFSHVKLPLPCSFFSDFSVLSGRILSVPSRHHLLRQDWLHALLTSSVDCHEGTGKALRQPLTLSYAKTSQVLERLG